MTEANVLILDDYLSRREGSELDGPADELLLNLDPPTR